MIGCGTQTFTDPDDFRAHTPGFEIALVLTGPDPFRTRVAWAALPCLRVSTIEERAARTGFMSLPSAIVCISFLVRGNSPAYCNGVPLNRGDVVLHAPGERFHQRATGPFRWGLIALPASDLDAYGAALLGDRLALPHGPAILRLPKAIAPTLLRLHRETCRLAEERPELVAHREVARALEQDLVAILVDGLSSAEIVDHATTRRRHASIMARFEDVLAHQPGRPLSTPELARAAGVSERTLRLCCSAFLGRSPASYARLRRLNLVRSALAHGAAPATSIATIAREHGFSEPGRFSTAYRSVFGETPSTTLRRSRPR